MMAATSRTARWSPARLPASSTLARAVSTSPRKRWANAPNRNVSAFAEKAGTSTWRTASSIRLLFNSTGPLVPNGVRENELVKAEIFKSEIHYRFNCFGHQSSTPIPSGEPKSSVLGSAWSPKL